MRTFLITALLVSCISTFAQDYSLKNANYYKNLEAEYQLWLDETGYGNALFVHSTDVENGLLSLYLSFNYIGNDSAYVVWNKLNADFETQQNYPFIEFLYRNMIRIMKTNPEFANIQVFSRDANNEFGCFLRAAQYNKADKSIETVDSDCQSAVENLELDPDDLKKSSLVLNLKNVKESKDKVYAKILDFAKAKYAKKIKSEKDFFHDNTKKSELYFEVRKINKEIFSEEENHILAEMINWFKDEPLDWRTNEELHFTIKFYPSEDQKSYSLDIKLEARYGSGFHEIKEWNKMTDFTKIYDYEQVKYLKEFKSELYKLLTK